MAETIKILDLDINYEKLVKGATDAKKSVEELTKQLKEQKADGKTSAEQIEITTAALKNAQNEYRANSKALTDLTAAGKEENMTIAQTRAALLAVTAQWSQLTAEETKNTTEGRKLTETKLNLTTQLKNLEAATGDNRRNVGNYSASILDAAKNNNLFGSGVSQVINTLNGAKNGLIAVRTGMAGASAGATGFAGAMNIVKVAIASTGIGLLIIGIAGLIAALSKMDPVVDKVAQVFAGVQGAMNAVVQVIVKFVQGIQSVGDVFTKLDQIIRHPIESIQKLRGVMIEAGEQAMDLKKQQQDLGDEQSIHAVKVAELEAQYAKLVVQAKNRSLTEQERIKLSKQASEIEAQIFDIKRKDNEAEIQLATNVVIKKGALTKQEIALLNEKGIAYANQLLNLGRINKEEYDNYQQFQIAKQDLIKEDAAKAEKLQNQQDILADKAAEKAEKAAQKAKDALEKKNALIVKGMEEQLRLQEAIEAGKIKAVTDDDSFNQEEIRLANAFIAEKEILDKKYEFQKKAAKGNAQELLVIETQHKADLAELNNKYNAITEANLKILADKSIAIYNDMHKAEQERVKADIKTEQEKAKALEELDAINFENKLAIYQLQSNSEHQLQLNALQRKHDAEVKTAKETGADVYLIDQKYLQLKKKLKDEEIKQGLAAGAEIFGNISELVGKQTKLGKAAAVAQATIQTYLAANEAYASLAGIPIVGPALGAVAAGVAIATGIKNVKEIIATQTPTGKGFSEGGVYEHDGYGGSLPGYSKYDNINAKLRGGEGIIVSEAMQNPAARNLASMINQAFGGRDFSVNGGFLNDGGFTSRSLQPDIASSEALKQAVVEAVKNVTIVTDVKDVILETQKRNLLVDKANI